MNPRIKFVFTSFPIVRHGPDARRFSDAGFHLEMAELYGIPGVTITKKNKPSLWEWVPLTAAAVTFEDKSRVPAPPKARRQRTKAETDRRKAKNARLAEAQERKAAKRRARGLPDLEKTPLLQEPEEQPEIEAASPEDQAKLDVMRAEAQAKQDERLRFQEEMEAELAAEQGYDDEEEADPDFEPDDASPED